MSRILRRPLADADLVAIFRYYAREAGLPVADCFFREAEATFARLAGTPGMGHRYEAEEPLYADLRYFPVSRFRKYVVFYRAAADGIEVIRVLHGARDVHSVLAAELGIEKDTGGDDEAIEPE